MKYLNAFICVVFLSLLISCGSDDEPTNSGSKEYDVEYQVTGTGIVNEVNYLNSKGDTLTAQNVSSGWSYKWTEKGKPGDETYIKLTIINSNTTAYFKILANNSVLIADSINGYPNSISTYARGTLLPY